MSATTTKGGGIAIIGYHYWGHGSDLKEAKKNFREAGGSLSNGYFIYEFPAGLEFVGVEDCMGGGQVVWNNPAQDTGLTPTVTKVKGRYLK